MHSPSPGGQQYETSECVGGPPSEYSDLGPAPARSGGNLSLADRPTAGHLARLASWAGAAARPDQGREIIIMK